MKKQIWLTPEQVELVIKCLQLTKRGIGETPRRKEAHSCACVYTINRIDEVLALFEHEPSRK